MLEAARPSRTMGRRLQVVVSIDRRSAAIVFGSVSCGRRRPVESNGLSVEVH